MPSRYFMSNRQVESLSALRLFLSNPYENASLPKQAESPLAFLNSTLAVLCENLPIQWNNR
jgi:hypothetical protein